MERGSTDQDGHGDAMARALSGAPAERLEPGRGGLETTDPVVRALVALEETLVRNVAVEQALGVQLRQLRGRRERGLSWREAMAGGDGSEGVLSLLGDLLARTTDAGAVLRRVLAAALLEEGASTAEVARRFGVSRQRIFRLLRGRGPAGPG